jgi:ABC-2 type transport system ATP-binding protein
VSVPAIELTEVTKRFGALVAVDRVSLRIQSGECYGLIGPNGAGKTTSFSMMCGYLFPTAGSIRILGSDPTRPGALKRKVGVLPQDAILPSAKVGALLTYWARLSGLPRPQQEAKEVLEKVGLPESWDTDAQSLSHGMAKRVAMAQALMGSPPVVMLDEPTAGLDPRIAAHVRQVIKDMKGRQTVIVSSHNLQELEELCDAAAILDRGKLAQAGTMAELTSRSAEFRVQVARGNIPLQEVRELRGCAGASLDPSGNLTVQFNSQELPAEEMITQTLSLLISRGVLILGVSRGRKLEDRVLELT